MQVVFFNGKPEEALKVNTSNSLLIISGKGLQDIDMVAELQGSKDTIKKLAIHSKLNQLVIVCLYYAGIYQKQYLSAIVIDNGKILGVSDMTHRVSSQFYIDRGQCYRVYDSSLGKFGLTIGDDVFFPEVPRLLRLGKADYFIALSPLTLDNSIRLCIKANSLFNGCYTMYSLADECGIIGMYGNTIAKSTDFCTEFELNTTTDNKLLLARRDDIYHDLHINDD